MWRKTNWSDPDIKPEDFVGGSRVRLTYPDGSVVVGKLSVEPGGYRQNDQVVMARVMTSFSGDTWMNVHGADVEVWESDALKE